MNIINLLVAYEFAKSAHGDQKRKTGEPYITHPVAVAEIARTNGADEATVIACLLHDVVEDTSVSLKEVEESFGPEVASLVDSVTKLETKELTFEKIKASASQDKRVMLMKLADRIHNTRDLHVQHPALEKTRERYKAHNPQYVMMGKEAGLHALSSQLQELTERLP